MVCLCRSPSERRVGGGGELESPRSGKSCCRYTQQLGMHVGSRAIMQNRNGDSGNK
jgi:hypothetical protein